MVDKTDSKSEPKPAPKPEASPSSTPAIDAAVESNDPAVNPQAQRPGFVEPERTPGTAPSVVPLPAGAAPSSDELHPLPEQAIDGYPPATKMQAEADEAEAAEKTSN